MAAASPLSGPSPALRRWHWLIVAAASAVAAGCAIGAWALMSGLRAAAVPGVGPAFFPSDRVPSLTLLFLTMLGGVVVLRGRPQRYGWLMLAAGVLISVIELAGMYAEYAWYVAPGLPFGRVAEWVQDLWMITFVFALLLLPALFPDGHSVGRWRRAVPVVAWAWVVLITAFMLSRAALDQPVPGGGFATVQPDRDPAGA